MLSHRPAEETGLVVDGAGPVQALARRARVPRRPQLLLLAGVVDRPCRVAVQAALVLRRAG